MHAMKAKTPLEHAIEKARAGQMPVADMLRMFARGPVLVPSASEVKSDGDGLMPLYLDKEGTPMVVCFTDFARIGEEARAAAPFCMQIEGEGFLRMVPPGCGLVVNPGTQIGFDMSPEGLQQFLLENDR
jgi:hypothetical protein